MKKLLTILAVLAAGAGIWWYLIGGKLPETTRLRQIAQQAVNAVKQTPGRVSAPGPLRATRQSPSAVLTQAGVLKWTSIARHDNGGLSSLALNAKLNAAAEAKLKDLFAKQYFEHVSLSGVGPGDLAEAAGYTYVSEGENLALGNFADDKTLVDAWMNSPGHRANILGDYSEIGIVVGQGVFEGHSTWIAVQEFGRPLSACPGVDPALKAKIETDKSTLNQLEAEAEQKKAELDAAPQPRTRDEVDAYNAQVSEYNALIARINDLIRQVQGEITVYNGQVQAFNACAGG